MCSTILLWRTVKYAEVYLKAYADSREARRELGDYFRFYNEKRPHQALGYRTPTEVFHGDQAVNRKVSKSGRMEGAWSGASASWKGDVYFDNPDEELVGFNSRRLEGAEGLLLLHVVHKDARGRSGGGIARTFHSPTLGVAIPAGGPSFSVVVNYAL